MYKIKKGMIGILLIIFLLQYLPVFAKDLQMSEDRLPYPLDYTTETEHEYGDLSSKFYIDGQIAYCIEPAVAVEKTGKTFTAYDVEFEDSAKMMEYQVNAIAYFGHGYRGDTSDDRYFAAQDMIWMLTGAKTLRRENLNKQPHIQDIEDLVQQVKKQQPYLETMDKYGKLHQGRWIEMDVHNGHIVKIEDHNQWMAKMQLHFQHAHLVDEYGQPVDKITTNPFYVKVDDNQDAIIEAVHPAFNRTDLMEKQVVYRSDDGQDMIKLGYLQPKSAKIVLHSKPTVTLMKYDEQKNPLMNALYEIRSNQKVQQIKTESSPLDLTPWIDFDHPLEIQEIQAPKGYYVNPKRTISLPKQIDTFKIEEFDDPIVYRFKKVDLQGKPIAGVTLALFHGEQKIAQWQTTDDPDGDQALSKGKPIVLEHSQTYRLQEIQPSKGYYYAQDISFTIPKEKRKDVEVITMVDQPIIYRILKVDSQTKKPLANAHFQLYLNDQQVADWHSTNDPQGDRPTLNGEFVALLPDTTYVLKEVAAPKGYYPSQDLVFTTGHNETKSIQLTVENQPIEYRFKKIDQHSKKPLANAHLQLFHDETLIADWYSTNLKQGDIATLNHQPVSLSANTTYTLQEVVEQPGYYGLSQPIVFTTSQYGEPVQTIEINNHPIIYEILKLNEFGQPVIGATLTLYTMDNQQLESWKTTQKPHRLDASKLIAGQTYVLKETHWIDGVYQAGIMQFTIPVQPHPKRTLTMIDFTTDIAFLKVDSMGRPIANAHLQILTKDQKVLYDFYSTDSLKGTILDQYGQKMLLKGGESYILREVEAPNGYALSQDIPFTVLTKKPNQTQMITMIDEYAMVDLTILKIDQDDLDKKLKGAVFQLVDEQNQPYQDAQAKTYECTTDEQGQCQLHFPYTFQPLYLQEMKAPDGYQKQSEKILVDLSKHKDYQIEMTIENQKEEVVNTSDPQELFRYGILFCSSLLSIGWLGYKKYRY